MVKKAVKTPEEILGIGPGASADEVKIAYRKMALQLHPDVSQLPDTEEKFKELAGAVAALKNRTNLRGLLDFDINDFDLNIAEPTSSRVMAIVGNVTVIEKKYTLEKKKPKLGSGG